MKANIDKRKIMVIVNDKAEIYMNRVQLKSVNSFKYLGTTLSKDSSSVIGL